MHTLECKWSFNRLNRTIILLILTFVEFQNIIYKFRLIFIIQVILFLKVHKIWLLFLIVILCQFILYVLNVETIMKIATKTFIIFRWYKYILIHSFLQLLEQFRRAMLIKMILLICNLIYSIVCLHSVNQCKTSLISSIILYVWY